MVSHKNYNLGANEGFVIFLTFNLITCLIDGFPLKMNSQSIVFLLNENEHTYWILNLENEMHSIWIIWTNGFQECKGNFIFWRQTKQTTIFGWDLKNIDFFVRATQRCRIAGPQPLSTSPWKFVGKIVSVTQCAPGLGKTWNNITLIYLNMSVTLKPTAEQLCTHIECKFPQITDTLAGVRATVEGGFQKNR